MAPVHIQPALRLDPDSGLPCPRRQAALVARIDSMYTINEHEMLSVTVELDVGAYPDALNEAASTVRRVMRGHLEDIFDVTVRIPAVDTVTDT